MLDRQGVIRYNALCCGTYRAAETEESRRTAYRNTRGVMPNGQIRGRVRPVIVMITWRPFLF